MAISVSEHQIWKLTGSVENARRHRVASLLYQLDLPGLPASARREFRKDYLKTFAQNLLFLLETKNVLEVLNEAGIPVIPLKGVLFASRFYSDMGCRPQSDIDVLVHEEDLVRAHHVLIQSDWQEAFPKEFYEGHYHWVYRRKGSSCLLEVHWLFSSPRTCAPSLNRVWHNARATHTEGIHHLELSPEDLLEYIAVNKAHQHYSMLLDFVDIAQIVNNTCIDWDRLLENVRHDRTGGALWFGLACAHKILNIPVPQAILDALAQQPESFCARRLERFLARRGGPLAVSANLLAGPSGRIYEAILIGYPSGIWNLLKPLIFPSDGRLRVLADGSYLKYWRDQIFHASGQIRVAISS